MAFAASICSRAVLRIIQTRSGGVRGAAANVAVTMVGGPLQQRHFLLSITADQQNFFGGRHFQTIQTTMTTRPLSTLSPLFSSLSQLQPTLLLTNSASSVSSLPQASKNDRQLVVYRVPAPPPGPSSFSLESFMMALSYLYKRAVLLPSIREVVQDKETEKARMLWREAIIRVHKSKEFKDVYKKRLIRFSKDERKALKEYTGSVYEVVNSALRSGSISTQVKKKANDIIGALTKLSRDPKTVYQGTVYRGTDLPANVKDVLQPGATYSDPAFLSTSAKQERAFRKEFMFQITSKTGVNVAKQSNIPSEAEVLFRPGTLFMIKSREEVGGHTLVVMDELH